MFNRVARIVTRFPRRVVVIAVLFTAVAGFFGGPVAGLLSATAGSFQDPASESSRAAASVSQASGTSAEGGLIAIVTGGPDQVARIVAEIAAVEGVASATAALTSNDHGSKLVSVQFRADASAQATASRVMNALAREPNVKLGGAVMANKQVGTQVQIDLAKAELLAFPILFLLSLWIFRGAVAALLPLMVGGITILGAFLGLRLVNSVTPMSVFAVNLITGMGLGLAIDYSLFMVSRYREELANGLSSTDAIRRALNTAGRTILFSSLTVAAALAALLVFPLEFLYSMGAGGIMVALIAATVALVVLPAVLVVLGPRVNALAPRRWQHTPEVGTGFWYRLPAFMMRRPVVVAAAAAALLVLLGLPFTGVKFTSIDASVLPTSSSARQVSDTLQRDFPTGANTSFFAFMPGDSQQAQDLASKIQALPGVTAVRPRPAGPQAWRLDVSTSGDALSDQAQNAVRTIRSTRSSDQLLVGGPTANLIDLQGSLRSHLPLGILIVASATILLLFLMTGSVILPIKAVLMNVLTLSAAFGVLVLIFQDGNLEWLFRFTSQGALESTQPVLLFAIVFGLSTDYGVFLLSRIKEAHDQGNTNTEAVIAGVGHTGRIVTAAAILFCVAVGAFATSQIVFIKELGVGIAAGVILDATVVRALLVPSLMALLGHWNWWAPAPLRRLHGWIGLRESTDVAAPPRPLDRIAAR